MGRPSSLSARPMTRAGDQRPRAPASSIQACPPFFQRRKNIASSAPDRLCHTENTAAGSAVSGVEAKWVFASVAANAEFCMPTSITVVRAALSEPRPETTPRDRGQAQRQHRTNHGRQTD